MVEVKLDIACGQNKTPGFKGIDLSGNADIRHDLFDLPWPVKANSVTEAVCNHFVEHIPHSDPRWSPTTDGWWVFFDELYRVMKKNATITLVHPYAMHVRAFWDPSHTRYIHETTWAYLDKEWRASQGLDHYPVKCDFEIANIDAVGLTDEFMNRAAEHQNYQRTHYWNVIADLKVILRARK